MHGVLLGWMLASLGGSIIFGLGRGLPVWIPAIFFGGLFSPLINGSNQAIWQAKVAPDLQGRVFSARRLIAWFTNPISPIIGGTLADFVLEPAMKAQTSGLAQLLGPVFGTGPGAGMSLLMVICGIGGFHRGSRRLFCPCHTPRGNPASRLRACARGRNFGCVSASGEHRFLAQLRFIGSSMIDTKASGHVIVPTCFFVRQDL